MSISKEQVLENLDEVKKILAELDSPAKTEEIKYFEIKNRWTGSVIYKSQKTTWKEAVKEALETRADLTGADLTRADLTGADLTGADLTACLFYFGNGNHNFAALCKAIKTIKHPDGPFDQLSK